MEIKNGGKSEWKGEGKGRMEGGREGKNGEIIGEEERKETDSMKGKGNRQGR